MSEVRKRCTDSISHSLMHGIDSPEFLDLRMMLRYAMLSWMMIQICVAPTIYINKISKYLDKIVIVNLAS